MTTTTTKRPKPAISRSSRDLSPTERTLATRAKSHNTGTMAAAAAVSPDKPLTDKQKLFVRCWAEGDSIAMALARAGYSVADNSLGYRMAKMPNVLALYAEYKRKYEEAAQMSRKRVMDGLLESIEMAKLMSEPATMVSGWREVARMCGYYEPRKVQVDVNMTGASVMDRLNRLSDAELLKIIQEQGATPLLEAPETGLYEPITPEDDQ